MDNLRVGLPTEAHAQVVRRERRLVRKRGFEPLRYCYRQPLKTIRLGRRTDSSERRRMPLRLEEMAIHGETAQGVIAGDAVSVDEAVSMSAIRS